MMAERWGLSRSQLDEYSLASHEKAAAAQDAGFFEAQIAAVPERLTGGEPVTADEGVRRGGSVEKLGGAEAGVRRGRGRHRRQFQPDLRRLGRAADDHVGEGGRARADPDRPHAHRGAGRRRSGHHADRTHPGHPEGVAAQRLRLDDIGVFEVNEAFATVPLAWLAEIGNGAAPWKRR